MIEITWPVAVVLIVLMFLVASFLFGLVQMHYGYYDTTSDIDL